MAHKESYEDLDDDFGPENDDDNYSDKYGDEEHEEEHSQNDEEREEDFEDELGNEEEYEQEDDNKKNKWFKYGIFGIVGVVAAGVLGTFIFHSSSPQNPNIQPSPRSSTAMTPVNGIQNKNVIPRPNVTVANDATLIQRQNAGNNQSDKQTPNLPPVNRTQFDVGQSNNSVSKDVSQYPPQDRFNYPQRNIQPAVENNNIERANTEQNMHVEIDDIKNSVKDLHNDLKKESESNKDAIMKKIDDMQEKLGEKIASNNSNYGGETQISGIRDMVSALKQSLDNANSSIKSQQDTITTLRTELNSMKEKESEEQSKKINDVSKKYRNTQVKKIQKTSSVNHESHVKRNEWTTSDWKLRGYNSSKNSVIIQSPENDYFEESIGYEARDDHGDSLRGVGKIKGVEKLSSGKYVLHTSLGEIEEGN